MNKTLTLGHLGAYITFFAVLFVPACGYFESDESKLSKAQEYIKQGDSNSAVVLLKKILQSNAENSEARFLLGMIEFSRYRMDDAIDTFKKAKQSQHKSEDLFYYWVKALMYKGDFVKIEEIFQDGYFKDEIDSPRGLILKGDYYALKGDHDAAKGLYDEHYTTTKHDAINCLSQVKLLSVRDEHAEVIAQSKKCEDKYGNNSEFDSNANRYLRALALISAKNHESARSILNELVASYADKADIHIKLQASLLLTKLYLLNSQPNEAAKLADSLLVYIYHPDLFYAKAMVAMQEKNYAVAEQLHLKALNMMPDYKPSLLEMVKIKYINGNTEQAKYSAGKVDGGTGGTFLSGKIDQLEAIKLYQQGDFDSVIESLSDAGQGADYKSQAILALAYARKSDRKKTWETYKEITRLRQEQPQNDLLKARLHVELGDLSEAEAIYKKYVAENNLHAIVAISELYLKAEKFQQAENMLNMAMGMQKDNKNIALLLVKFYETTGNKEKLYTFLQRMIKQTGELGYKVILAKMYFRYAQYEDAQKLSQEIIRADDRNFDAYIISANVYANEKKYSEAEQMLGKAVAVKPGYIQAYLLQARMAYLKSDYDAAHDYLKKALSSNSQYLPALSATIDLYIAQAKKEEAVKFATAAMIRLTDKKSGQILLGNTYRKTGDDGNALKQFKAALKEDVSDIKLAILVYEVSVKELGNATAEKELTVWLANSGKLEHYLVAAGHALSTKQYELAQAYYQTYLAKDDTNPVVLNNLSWLYMENGDNQKALQYAKKGLSLSPESPEILDSVGWLLLMSGQYDEAEPYLQKAQAKLSKNPTVNFHLAKLYYLMNKKDKSRAYLDLTNGLKFPEEQEARDLLEKL